MVTTTLRKLLGVAVGFLILIKLSLDTVEYDMQNYGDRGECSAEAGTTQQWRGGGVGVPPWIRQY